MKTIRAFIVLVRIRIVQSFLQSLLRRHECTIPRAELTKERKKIDVTLVSLRNILVLPRAPSENVRGLKRARLRVGVLDQATPKAVELGFRNAVLFQIQL